MTGRSAKHLGVASLDIRFAAEDSGVYHSAYDDFNWNSHFSDTTFACGRTLSLGATVSRYPDEIEKPPVDAAYARDLASDPGLLGRPWFRHRIYAPGKYTGCEAKTLPGISEAAEAGNAGEEREQAGQVTEVLRALSDHIEQAQKLMGEL